MDLKTVIDSAPTLKEARRTFTAEFKHQLIQQCQQPDTSVAKVAMQHQINADCYINGFVSPDQCLH
ncbi:transposase [Acinetobacter baumannii]